MKPLLWKLLILTVLVLALAACELPAPNPPVSTTSPDLIATQVAAMLTASPAPTQTPPPVVTETLAPTASQPAATKLPATNAPQPTATTAPTTAPTAAPTNAPAPTSTSAPAPTATTSPNDPRKTLGNPTFSDTNFQEGENWGSAWKNEFTEGSFSNHQMVLTSVGVDGWTFSWPKIANFYLEMTATSETCAGKDRYGIMFRAPDTFDQGYQFGITCDGQYAFRMWDPKAKKYNYLIDWTKSDAINQGSNQTNRVGVMADGSKFSLYVNGVFLKDISNSTYSEGRFGPWIGHDKTNDFTIKISEIDYWELP